MASNFFDQFDTSTAKPEGGGNFFDQFDPASAKPEPASGTASDLGNSLKVGVQKLPGMVTGLADLPIALATGARPFTKAADALGEATGFQPGKWADETKFSQGYEDSKKAVDAAWKDGSAADIAGAYLSNPAYTANQVAESLPSMVAGGVASKALLGAGRVAGVAADAAAGTAAKAATPGLVARTVGEKWAAPVAAGVGEGAVTAGQQMDGYQGKDQQKNALAALGAGVGTAVIGVGAGRLANKMGLETAETAMAKVGTGAGADVPLSLKQRVLGGMVSEAVLQELPQSVQEQMWSNFADGKPLMEGVARAGTEGALAGGVMGAGANLRGGSSHAKARQNAEAAAASAQALTQEAMQPPTMDTIAGESINPVDRGAPATFEDLVTPAPTPEPDPYTAWDQQAARPSEAMGIDPAAGPLSRIAVQAVDSGAYMPPAGQAPALAPEPDPVVLQNRDRTSAASIAQMQEIAANPDYLRVGPSRDMTSGAPVVFGELPPTALLGRPETVVDGHGQRMGTQYAVVDAGDLIASNNADGTTVAEYATGAPGKLRSVAGNGRTAGLQAAYQMGTAQRYRQELAGDAAALGVDAQALATMQRPVLVRVMQGADVTRDMGDRTNITATQKLSPLEQAGNDARRLDVGTLAFDEGGNPTPDAIKGFVSAMPVAERGDMLNPDGTPTRQAVDRLMAATFKQAYESDELVQLYAQATDPDARAVMAAAADASGVLANLKGAGEFDVRGAVADAAKMAVNAARQGLKLSDVLQNQDLDMSPEAYPVAAYLAQHIRTPKKMAEGLRRWGQLALEQARIADENTHQGSLLGPRPTLSRPEIFARLGSEANPTGQGIAPAAPAPQPAPEQAALVPAPQSPQSNPNGEPNGPQADQAQQAAPQQSEAPAQATAAAVARHPTWRQNAIQAGRVALALGLQPKGKRLAQIVAEVDAVDAQQTGAAQDGADLSSGPIDQEWSAFAPETGTLGIARAQMPQIKAEHRGALVNFLKARGIDSAAGEVPANDLKPTQAEFAPGKVKKAREFQGSERSILVSSDGHVVDGHHQWLAKRAAGEPVKVIRLKAPIRDVLAQVAEFPSTRMAEGAARATPAQAATDSGADAQGAGAMFSRAVPGPQDFVPAPDGGLDYGEITPEMGKAMRRQAGVIRLQQGVQNADGTGWGLAHIEANHGNQIRNAGFASVQGFVAHIANGFNEVLQASKGGQLLVAVSTGRRDVMFVQLEAAQEGDFYRVNTAFPASRNYLEKQESKGAKILWSGSEPRSTATGQQPPYAGNPDDVSGQDAPIARGENSLNEPLWERAGTSAPTADKSSSPSPWGQSGSASVALKDDAANYARADEPMSPDLARAILALGSPPKQATKESVRAAVRELVNGLGLLPNRLGRIVVATSAEIKQDWEPLIGPTGMEASGDAGRAQGFYDPKSKTVFLIADNILQGDELGVVAHELMHKHGPAVLGEEGWNRLHGALGGWAKAKLGSMERIVYDEAVRRVQASGPELSTQELFPYAVQVALEMGVRPNAVAPQGTVERWLGQVRAALRQVWDKITRKPELFKSQDLVNLAFGIAQRESPEHAGELDGAVGAAKDNLLKPGDPMFSRAAPTAKPGAAGWAAPSASQWDDFVYKLQDKHIDTKRVLESIRATGKAIADDLDVYLQEELYHGRAAKRTQDFVSHELEPLMKYMADSGLKMQDVQDYLHARHAKEANRVVAQRNPKLPDGGSGMTDAEADAVLASFNAIRRAQLERAAARVDAMIAGTRQAFVEYGLESQDTVDAWAKTFAHYVPLMREQDGDGMAGLGTGQGFSIKGREVKGRTGSTRKVVDILANIAMQRERAIVRGEKNRVATALVGLAKDNPSALWQVDVVPTRQTLDKKTGMVTTQHDPLYKQRDNVVVAKIPALDKKTGKVVVKEHAVVFNEGDARAMRMATALKNLDAPQLEGLLGATAQVTRYLAAINTQYNPIFGVTNLARDVQGAALNLAATPLAGKRREVLGQTLSALAGIYADERARTKGKGGTASPWAQLWEEFQSIGGQTGYRDQFRTSADRGQALAQALDPSAWTQTKWGQFFTAGGRLKVPMEMARKAMAPVFAWLDDYNTAMENGVRLAAYKTARDAGMSKERAASLAKNLTTNFNRKGQSATQVGALYAFFNASVQGTARIGQTLFDMEPGQPKTLRLSAVGKKIVAGGVLLGSMQALLLAAMGFDDEEPPDHVRERNLVIPDFVFGSKKYLTIPMPLGFHVLPNLGRIPAEFVLSGFSKPAEHVLKLVGLFSDTFNPIGNAGLSMQTLAPTVLDPLAALAENKDFSGRAIAKESFNKMTPGHALARDTASLPALWLAEGINYLTGGTRHVRGALSPTPDQIDYLVGQVTGGVGREATKAMQTAQATASGDDLPAHKVPLLGRFYGNADSPSAKQAAFYRYLDEVARHAEQVKGLRLEGKGAEALAYAQEHPQARLHMAARAAQRQIKDMRERRRELEQQGASREEVRALEQRMTQRMERFNALAAP